MKKTKEPLKQYSGQKRIVIIPRHCTNDEYEELFDYIQEQEWDYMVIENHEPIGGTCD